MSVLFHGIKYGSSIGTRREYIAVSHALCFTKATNRRKQGFERLTDQRLCNTAKPPLLRAAPSQFSAPGQPVMNHGSRFSIEGCGQIAPGLDSLAFPPTATKSGPANAQEARKATPCRSAHSQRCTL
jgi:hypothetical protein